MLKRGNNVFELKDFFSVKEMMCSPEEFRDFWKSLTEDEKEYFRRAELKY